MPPPDFAAACVMIHKYAVPGRVLSVDPMEYMLANPDLPSAEQDPPIHASMSQP